MEKTRIVISYLDINKKSQVCDFVITKEWYFPESPEDIVFSEILYSEYNQESRVFHKSQELFKNENKEKFIK